MAVHDLPDGTGTLWFAETDDAEAFEIGELVKVGAASLPASLVLSQITDLNALVAIIIAGMQIGRVTTLTAKVEISSGEINQFLAMATPNRWGILIAKFENGLNATIGAAIDYTTSGSFGNFATVTFSATSSRLPVVTPSGAPTLSALTLSADEFTEGATAGTVIGTISGKTTGSTLSIFPADTRVAISGSNLVVGSTPATDGTFSITIRETLAGATNTPRDTTFPITVNEATPTLAALSLSNDTFAEDDASGTVIGAITGKTSGSTLSITPSDGRVAIAGTNLVVGLTPATDGDFSITVRETLAGATNTPRDTPFTLTVEAAAPVLADLALSNDTFTEGDPEDTVIGAITGKASGSTLSVVPNDGRFKIVGTNLVVGPTVSSDGDIAITIVETLAGAVGSPKDNDFTITVEAAPAWYDEWTFSRASARTARNYDGSIVSFASGVKAITDMGFSLERTTTNIIPSPLNLSAWVANDGTVTSEGGGVYKFLTNTVSAAHGFSSQNVAVTNGGFNGAYVDVKPGGGARYVQLVYSSFGFGSTHYANFDLLSAEAGTVGAGLADNRVELLADGWFRLYIGASALATVANSVFFVRIVDSRTSARNQAWVPTGTEFLLFRGAQMAANSYPTSLIDGTRAADSLTRIVPATTGDLAFLLDAIILPTNPIGGILFEWANAASAPTQYVRIKCTTTGQISLTANSGSGETTVITENQSIYSPRRVSVGAKLTTATWSLVVNGTTVTVGTAGPAPVGLTHMRLGSDNGGGAGNSAPVYVKSFTKLDVNPTVAEFRVLTQIADAAPVFVPAASAALKETLATFQAIPGIGRSTAGRTFAVWGRRFGLGSAFGERPGTTAVLAFSDNDTAWTVAGYFVPNYYDAWIGQPAVFEAPDGTMWLMYSIAGDGLLYNGRYGVWVAQILNPTSSTPSIGTPRKLVNGVGMKMFKIGTSNYVTVDVWANEVTPVHAGVTAGRFIYQINGAFDSLTLVSTLPNEAVALDRTFDETSAVELPNGTVAARWRTKSGAKQSILTGGIGGTWGAATVVSGTNAASRSTFFKGPGGAVVWAYNASAIGSARANMTLRVSTDNLATEPYTLLLDARTDTSYPDIIIDQTTGDVRVVYDRERLGAREIIMAHGFTVAQIIAGTAVVTLTVIADGSV
ncbi:sialidase family protein [Asticcacaulis endophyticus]|uniref:Sialidase domain-containing protein n=1 Tax=Asticcacaulis endophyticus TaxID=1395890 RepID=A0A918PSY5_9CAUL|nr:sialidase family protein [Asticcacaulis endophyticus]GGZ21658.1 hypothetical protein GCM10011273_03030 [Asticcacaulis endophyticus]